MRVALRRRPRTTNPVVLWVSTTDLALTKLLLDQLLHLRACGAEVVTASGVTDELVHLDAHGFVHHEIAASTRAASVMADARAAWQFLRVLLRVRPDVVHTHTPKPALFGRVLARLTGVPLVINTVHGYYVPPTGPLKRRLPYYALEAVAAVFSDAELFVNVEDQRFAASRVMPSRKTHYIGNGVDTDRFSPQPSGADRARIRRELGIAADAVVIGSVGRLVREKGFVELAQAASMLADGVVLLVVGPRDEAKPDALREADIAALAGGRAVFAGMRQDVEALYRAMDVFVLASHREGLPLSPMEAMATGLPAVVTNIRGCRQVVDDGVEGLLVPVADAVALHAALARLVTDAHLRRTLGERGRRRVLAEFSREQTCGRLEDIYGRLGVTLTKVSAGSEVVVAG
jgi:glycosyltransferase involved in cell wall biosynthesis